MQCLNCKIEMVNYDVTTKRGMLERRTLRAATGRFPVCSAVRTPVNSAAVFGSMRESWISLPSKLMGASSFVRRRKTQHACQQENARAA